MIQGSLSIHKIPGNPSALQAAVGFTFKDTGRLLKVEAASLERITEGAADEKTVAGILIIIEGL